MSDTVLACHDQECDSTQIQRRSGRDGKAPPGTWHCNQCGADFAEPRRRERRDGKTDTAPRGTLAAVLEEMDPDDLVADGGMPLRPAPDDLDEQTIQRELYCREHRVVKVVDKLGRPVCPVCLVTDYTAEVLDGR